MRRVIGFQTVRRLVGIQARYPLHLSRKVICLFTVASCLHLSFELLYL